jgi:hypothetical protein
MPEVSPQESAEILSENSFFLMKRQPPEFPQLQRSSFILTSSAIIIKSLNSFPVSESHPVSQAQAGRESSNQRVQPGFPVNRQVFRILQPQEAALFQGRFVCRKWGMSASSPNRSPIEQAGFL